MTSLSSPFTCLPVTGLAELRPGDDLGALLVDAVELADGDILVVTSKALSKVEGRVVVSDRQTQLAGETQRVVARRAGTWIVRTRHGLVLAAGGIDASNTAPGTVVLLPLDPDGSARRLRVQIGQDGGPNVAVLVTDTLGRAWRKGQTDVAIGAAGLEVLQDHTGVADGYGNLLSVTAPAIADEIAGAADLAKGKVGRCPAAVVRGLGHLVTTPGEHGSGAAALVRPEAEDMFGFGSREAVLHAVRGDVDALRGFGGPAPVVEVIEAIEAVCTEATVRGDDHHLEVRLNVPDQGGLRALGIREARLSAVAFAMGWYRNDDLPSSDESHVVLGFVPATT